jgi:hypothetical protein
MRRCSGIRKTNSEIVQHTTTNNPAISVPIMLLTQTKIKARTIGRREVSAVVAVTELVKVNTLPANPASAEPKVNESSRIMLTSMSENSASQLELSPESPLHNNIL